MEPGDLVKIKIKFTPKNWSQKKPMMGVLLRRWSKELKIPEFDFFGESDEDIAIEITEPYWEVRLSNGKRDFFKETELEKVA
tara:strand:+ start:321 stop:566 length:246 start_codon:yes stop_codon:yes gene_type:complete